MLHDQPPYWGKREYGGGGVGLEKDHGDYVQSLCRVFAEVRRVLKPTGSFWLNIGDTYRNKSLTGIPWRIALRMIDNQGWTLRNSIIWNKVKGGPDNTRDRLRNVYEDVFHFVKCAKTARLLRRARNGASLLSRRRRWVVRRAAAEQVGLGGRASPDDGAAGLPAGSRGEACGMNRRPATDCGTVRPSALVPPGDLWS